MTQVVLGENEGIESALRRFKRQVSRAGIFQDMRKNGILKRQSKKPSGKLLPNTNSANVVFVVDLPNSTLQLVAGSSYQAIFRMRRPN